MASYAALASLTILFEDIIDEGLYPDFLDGREQILGSLHGKVNYLLESLEGFASEGDEAADRVERRIREAAHQVQDIIEFEISKQGVHSKLGKCDEDLKNVEQEVDSIVEEVEAIQERQVCEEVEAIRKRQVREEFDLGFNYCYTHEYQASVYNETLVGLEWDLMAIKDHLCKHTSHFRVIPIVGTGGIGKTTLARSAFEDASIVQHFDCRVWITASKDYNLIRILESILESLGIMTTHELPSRENEVFAEHDGKGKALKGSEEEGEKLVEHEAVKTRGRKKETLEERRRNKERALEEHVQKYLKDRKYLIVIDDVWSKEAWDDMKGIFPNDSSRSRIVLTTRLLDVAHYAGTPDSSHEMQLLDPSESWNLLQEKVFGHNYCPPELEEIGMLIARKCHGLPLGILVIAGILSNFHAPLYWEKIARYMDSISAEMKLDDDSIVERVKAIKESRTREYLQLDYDADIGSSEQKSVGMNTMVGYEGYLKAIRSKLCYGLSKLQVILIVGKGGIGKTTLARNAYEDYLIVNKFDLRAWVTISQEDDVISFLQNLLNSIAIGVGDLHRREEDCDVQGTEEDRLKKQIHRHLRGQKYLIVIDDLWSTKSWISVEDYFPNENNGSWILLTTRLMNLVKYNDTFSSLQMEGLNADVSWDLLREKVFGKEHCPLELVVSGKSIANKCRGLPLAITTIAGVISNLRTPQNWTMVARNLSAISSTRDEQLSGILSLSFKYLPYELKACFLYMGSFPEDYEISISRLTRLWVAEGFMKLNQTELCLKYLVQKNLVHVTKKRANGQFKNCAMHDLVRDFCRHRGFSECFFHDKDRLGHFYPTEAEKVRRIILDSFAPYKPWPYNDGKYVQSLCWFSKMTIPDAYSLNWGSRMAFSNIHSLDWDSLKLLKIMDVADIVTPVAPFAVSRMFHSKYLALRLGGKNKKQLPQSIFKFQNLQTLNIYTSKWESISLPSEIWKMPRLMYLIIDRMILPPAPPGDVPQRILESLQTLETVEDFTFTKEATLMICNIRKLKLVCCRAEDAEIWKLYCLNNIVNLFRLEELKIMLYTPRYSYVNSLSGSSFEFPYTLKKLSLEGCRLPWENLTVVGCLPYLLVLKLRKNAFVGEAWKPAEGEFDRLKFLLLESLDLKFWKMEPSTFRHLERLKIINCGELEEIPLEFGEILTLEFIWVHHSKTAGHSVERILKQQHELGNYDLQVFIGS